MSTFLSGKQTSELVARNWGKSLQAIDEYGIIKCF
jgi:hypothetical protein